MFPLKCRNVVINQGLHSLSYNPDNVRVIEGADIYDTLCPVNDLTGCRANPLELLQSLSDDPVRSRKLSAILQDLPSIASDSRLSDDEKIDMLCDKLSTGVPADDDRYRSVLEKIAEPLFKSLGGSEKESESKIEFNQSDVPSESAAPAAE